MPTSGDFEDILETRVSDNRRKEYDNNVCIVADKSQQDMPNWTNRDIDDKIIPEKIPETNDQNSSNKSYIRETNDHIIDPNTTAKIASALDNTDHPEHDSDVPIDENHIELVEEFLSAAISPCQEHDYYEPRDPDDADADRVAEVTDELLPYEFVSGTRQNTTLLYSIAEKHAYRFKKSPILSGNRQRYVCSIPTCMATLYMVDGRLTKLATFKAHNHANREEAVLKFQFETAVRRLCVEQSMKPSEAFAEVLKE